MLEDARAIEIISRAKQKNVAMPKRSSRDFDRIFDDFFSALDFTGQHVCDLGPGQYDFARRIHAKGGVTHNVDNDPAVIELGRHFGFDVLQANLKSFNGAELPGHIDGLFCKFSINAFWFEEASALENHIRALDAMLTGNGWGWIAPWNGTGQRGLSCQQIDDHLKCQARAFHECGWAGFELSDDLAAYYGVSGNVANHALFLKRLAPPRPVAAMPRLAM